MKLGHGLRPRSARGAVLAAFAALVYARAAAAHAGGIVVTSCTGCHGNGAAAPQLSLSAEPAEFNPGDSVTLTLTIQSPSIRDGGVYVTTGSVGTLQALSGEGLASKGLGLTHTAPKAAQNGTVTFRFGWQAPSKPGGVDFGVAALAGNGNNASSGDAPGSGEFQWAFGCEGNSFYVDLDRDGYGSKQLGTLLGCSGDPAPTGYATLDGDCDENNENVHPGAHEVCNKHDDDCNGQIDENAPPVMMWPDGDGDGYYPSETGTPKVGCGNLSGYAANRGDCNDLDSAIHPGAAETCNNRDDNCDGEIDERVRPQCGVGWCSRYSSTCDAADCYPGPPRAETCNQFDDDCDGEDDNGACSSSGGSATSGGSGPATVPSPIGARPTGSPDGCSLGAGTIGGASVDWVGLALAACLGLGRKRRARAR